MNGLLEDVRYALRQVRKSPRLLVLIVVILGIGIGATATIFSLIEAAGNLPIRDQKTTVLVFSINPARMLDRTPISAGDFADMKTRLPVLQDLAAFSEETVHVQGPSEPTRLSIQRVTTNFFSVLGVAPAFGRDFNHEDVTRNQPVVILAHGTWQNEFGADSGILSRTIQINGLEHRVVGVMKPEFQYLSESTALWLPMKDPITTDDRGSRELIVVGRLRNTADTPQLQAQAALLATQLAAEHPDNDAGWQFSITGTIPVRRDEAIVLAFVVLLPFLVLGIACANIANVLLARAVGRQREVAVRIALGASRIRIIRLLLIESGVYALAGGGVGILAGIWGTDLIRGFSLFWANAKVDIWVLAASLLTALLSGLLFGITPALQMIRVGAGETLKRTSSATTIDRRGHRLRSALMVGEVAAATLLLLLAGLVLRSVEELRTLDTGFRIDGVQTFRTALLEYRYQEPAGAVQGHRAILDGLRQTPGVRAAGAGTRVPTQGGRNNPTQQLEIQGRVYLGKERDWAQDLSVTPGYFEALAVPLLRGRDFNSGDLAFSAPVAVISQTMAKRYWGNGVAVGQKFRLAGLGTEAPWITVAGVVGDVRNDDAGAPPLPILYFPLTQHPARQLTYVLQTSGGASIAAATIRATVAKVEPGIPIHDVKSMRQLLNDDLAGAYFTAGFLAVLGIIALSLAALGIFGVLSHVASEHRPEIAIRMALGAEPSQIVRRFVGKALRLTSAGIAVGGAGAAGAFRLIRSSLSDVSVVDPIAASVVVGMLLLVAGVACYFPVRRATRLDPMTVLRWE
jgi:putative ABC transport system permease protein